MGLRMCNSVTAAAEMLHSSGFRIGDGVDVFDVVRVDVRNLLYCFFLTPSIGCHIKINVDSDILTSAAAM